MIVYFARNRVNGKGYVGKTKRSLEARVDEHLRYAKNGCPWLFHRAIRKYGADAFTWSVLLDLTGTHYSEGDLGLLEEQFIFELGTFGLNGYNMTRGGEGTSGHTMTEDGRKRLAAAAKKRYESGHGELMRARRKKGADHYFAGKDWGRKGPLSEIAKAKISAARKGRSLSEAHKTAIKMSCTGRQGVRNGSTWSESERSKHSKLRYLKKKPVFGFDEVGSCVVAYLSLEDAMSATGLGRRVLAGARKKYRLKYVNGVTYKRSEMTIAELKSVKES